MKKPVILSLLFMTVIVFEFCHSSKKAQKSIAISSPAYSSNVQNIVAATCSPCHVGPGARIKRLDSYDAVKNNIDDIIRRIQLSPSDKEFMPMRHPKLPDSTIQVFVAWKNGGFAQ